MKLLLLRAGLLTSLLLGLFYREASAESDWSTKCSSYGEIKQTENPSFQHMNCLLTNAALDANIPPEVVKAVAFQETGWKQFNENGDPLVSEDGGIGLMQITNQSNYNQEQLKNDIIYNLQAGINILSSMYNNRTDLPKIKNAGRQEIENWYFPVMAYNGIKPVNSPLYKDSGLKNKNAYQEKVFFQLEKQSFLNDPYLNGAILGLFPFTTGDFQYDTSNKNIVFSKTEYVLNGQMHTSSYLFKTGDKVFVTQDSVNLRKDVATSQNATQLSKNTTLVINGDFLYDTNSDSKNQFVWYPVKTEDGLSMGYISSAYIMKKLDPPTVNTVDDNSAAIKGKAEANVKVYAMVEGKEIGEATAENGEYTIKITKQKAGTTISVYAVDFTGNTSPINTVKVLDRTAPSVPTVNPIYDDATLVTGKAETNAKVFAMVGNKKIGEATAKNGVYTINIPKQKARTAIVIYALDTSGNMSAGKTVIVIDKTPPSVPTVNPIYDNAASITGKAETNAKVFAMVGNKKIGEGIVKNGKYIFNIPKQKAGTAIVIYASDASGNKSERKTVIVYDKTPPSVPTVNKITSKSLTVTGKGEKGATIFIYNRSKNIGNGIVDSRGNFKVKIKVQKKGSALKVYAQDKSRNKSKSKTIYVK